MAIENQITKTVLVDSFNHFADFQEAASNFLEADKDEDNLVNLEELKKYMKDKDGSGNLGDMKAKLSFAKLDSNGDGYLDFEGMKQKLNV